MSGGAHASSASHAPIVSCDFIARITTSSAVSVSCDGWSTTGIGERLVVVGRLDAQAAVADRLVVRAACDERDVVAVLEEPRADHAADRSRAVHDEPHGRALRREPVAEEREHAVERVLRGMAGLVDEVLGEHRVRASS